MKSELREERGGRYLGEGTAPKSSLSWVKSKIAMGEMVRRSSLWTWHPQGGHADLRGLQTSHLTVLTWKTTASHPPSTSSANLAPNYLDEGDPKYYKISEALGEFTIILRLGDVRPLLGTWELEGGRGPTDGGPGAALAMAGCFGSGRWQGGGRLPLSV